jgi:hypothetical protein
MQDDPRKQLRALCLSILQNEESYHLTEQIEQCQALLKSLYFAEFVQNHKPEAAAPTPEIPRQNPAPIAPVPEEKPEESPSVEQSIEATPKASETETPPPPIEAPVDFGSTNTETESLGLDDFVAKENVKKPRKGSLNQQLGQGNINFGLNDRIAFVKHLFGENMTDFNRVVSQLNTFEDFEEAEHFIENLVKPDYDWYQKEEYELRFKNVIRQRFGLDEIEE